MKIAVERWKGNYSESRTITLSKDTLPAEESILILGMMAVSYSVIYNLPPWK
jgi:hypothetical protein